MKKLNFLSLMVLLIFFFLAPNNLFANNKGNEKGNKPNLQKTTTGPSQTLMNINNATMWVTSEGFHDWIVASSWNGAFPNGSQVGAIFAEGIVWGGKVTDGTSPIVRVNGNTYGSGTFPLLNQAYRVRPDYKTADLTSDAATFNSKSAADVSAGDIQALRDQYESDWNTWPVDQGAPYKDVNNNGTYEPNIDIPGIPGASQTLFVKYDDRLSESNYGSLPIGLEISETYWAYASAGPLGNVIYKKVNIVYKGTSTSASNSRIDSMFIVQWADPDVGVSSDDFAGCDTTLNLGYAYTSKATDGTYSEAGLPPPAAGYDFMQGVSKFTGNPDDSAMFNLQWRKGYKYINRKPMSSFVYFAAGGAWGDPGFNYNGSLSFYNLMRGYSSSSTYPTVDPFPEEVADYTSDGIYLLDGDPIFGIGKIDGKKEGPGDRRIMVTNGPISMNLGDTAQVVVALVYGLGTNNLSSISAMKYNDAFAQYAYDQLFNVPLMPTPDVKYTELENEKVSLYWSNNPEVKNSIENETHGPYTFEAYSVYQLPYGSIDLTKGVRVFTSDVIDDVSLLSDKVLDPVTGLTYLKPITFLDNVNGISRHFTLVKDYLKNASFYNGQTYTFAVTAIGYNNDPSLPGNILESAPAYINVTPQKTVPGEIIPTNLGDTLAVTRTAGGSDGNAYPIVIDPKVLTGLSYTISFAKTTEGETVWNVDRSDGVRVLSDQTNQNADNESPIVDGIQFRVIGAPNDFKNFIEVSNANGPHDPTYAAFAFNSSGFPTGDLDEDRPTPNAGDVSWGVQTGWNDSYTYDNFISRVERNDNWSRTVPYDFEIRFTATGGVGDEFVNGEGIMPVPFELWNIGIGTPDDPSDDYRMIPLLYDYDANGDWGISTLDHGISGGDNDPETDWIYWYDPLDKTPGSAGYDAFVAGDLNQEDQEVMARVVFVNFNGGSVSDPTFPNNLVQQVPETGTVYRFLTTKPNQANVDVFNFTAPAPTFSIDVAKKDVGKINVFPNPYYGYQNREVASNNKYVTFSHLPDNAVIRIFDLSGVLVKTINHVSTGGQFDTWNLANDNNYPVSSGIYIVYIEMPDLGTTKILKLAIVQEQQFLKVY